MLRRVFDGLAALTARRPVVVVLVVVVLTAVFGGLAGQAVTEDGVAVDNELSAALERIDEEFGETRSVLQVVVTAEDGGDVRRAEALEYSQRLQAAIEDSDVADTLIDDAQQPAVAGYLGAAAQGAQMAGLDPAELDDAEVRELQEQALEQLPPQVAGLFEGLIGDGEPPSTGLILVFQDTTGLADDSAQLDQQRELIEVVDGVEAPEGLAVEPFSFGLLLADGDIGPEVGRLFGTALVIILVVLSLVYWLRPSPGQRPRILRRTTADVGLTLAVIVLAVVWMQGLGVLLGPDYLGLIGYFSPQTQIVPILIVGLGVDFAIHLLARYRTEVGLGTTPTVGYTTSMRTVGLTLLLVTAATAIGFLTNLASPVDFLATLGVLAAAGIASAFVLTLTLLPAIRVSLDRRAERRRTLPSAALASQSQATLPRVIGRTAWLAERVPVPTLLVAVLLAVIGGYGFTQLDSEFNLTDFVPSDEPLLETYATIQDEFDGGFDETTEVLLTGDLGDPETREELDAAVERTGELADVETLGDRPDAQVELGEDEQVARVSLRTSAGQGGALALQEGLQNAFAPLEQRGVEVTPTSQQILQADIGEQIEDSQIASLLIALAAAMALLVVHFTFAVRRPVLGVLTVLPVGLVLALTFATMAVTGIPLNPVTATLAALSIGIGVPFTIHVTSRFLEERRRPYDGQSALRRTVAQTGGALAGSALTTAIGFGILTTSTLVPFEQLGYVIVYAIAFSLLAAVLVLPSLLALWDRRDRARAEQVGGQAVASRWSASSTSRMSRTETTPTVTPSRDTPR
ncbi:MAG: efflux RND transporter permease subunit [Nitriliruptoraceae bacterium]